MYPIVRLFHQMLKHRNDPPLAITGTHVSHHYCMPWDIDMWMELNNGRTLTLYDLGRIPFAKRVGLLDMLKRRSWALTVAGASVMYRKRVRMFDRLEMHSSCIGRDERFIYITQSMWRDGEATSSILLRTAVTDKNGIVPTGEIAEEFGDVDWNPELPEWVQSWIKGESQRPWPPEL